MPSILVGLSMPLHALRLILRSPLLFALSLIPATLTLVLYFLALPWAKSLGQAGIQAILLHLGISLGSFGGGLVSVLLWLILIFAGAILFSSVAALLATPFNDYLAEKTEAKATPPLEPVHPPGITTRLKLIGIDLLKTVFATGTGLFILLLSWLPGVNLALLPLAWGVLAFQFLSYPQTRRGEGVGRSIGFIRMNLGACLGFGASCSLLFAIPVISAFFLPVAVVGGTLLYAHATERARRHPLER